MKLVNTKISLFAEISVRRQESSLLTCELESTLDMSLVEFLDFRNGSMTSGQTMYPSPTIWNLEECPGNLYYRSLNVVLFGTLGSIRQESPHHREDSQGVGKGIWSGTRKRAWEGWGDQREQIEDLFHCQLRGLNLLMHIILSSLAAILLKSMWFHFSNKTHGAGRGHYP